MKNINYLLLIFTCLIFQQCTKKASDVVTKVPYQENFRSTVPSPGPARAIKIGKSTNFQLDNGLTVIIVENHKLPRVSYQLSMKSEPLFEGDIAGYTSLAGNLINQGTTNRTKAQIDQEIDFIGASLNTGGRGMYASSLKKHSSKLMDIFTDVLYHAGFPKAEFDKAKTQTLSGLETSKSDANSMSSNVTNVLTYGADHVFGEVQTIQSTEKITLDDCKEYYDTYFVPNNFYLIIVGDVTPDEAKKDAQKYFGQWERKNIVAQQYNASTQPEKSKVSFVHKDNAVQSVISVKYPINLKPGTADVVSAKVMNSILGSGPSSRLFTNLREKHAYTYSAGSGLSSGRIVGNFSAGLSVRNEVTDSAVYQVLHELKRITMEKVDPEELNLTKNAMAGSFARSLEQPQTIAGFALSIYRNKLAPDYYETYLQRLDAVTSDDVLAMAKKYIKPDNAYITVVGDKEKVADNLLQFDDNEEIDYYDAYGALLDYDAIALPEGVDGQSVIEDFFGAMGGKDKLEGIKTMVISAEMSVMGNKANVSINQKSGEKYAMAIELNGMQVQTQKFDGEKALNGSMGSSKISLEGSPEYDALKKETMIFKELRYFDDGYDLQLSGIELVNDVKCYKLNVTDPAGKSTIQYYSIENGLPIRSVSTQEAQGQTMTISTDYSDYKETNGILLPYTTTVSGAMPQPLKMVINSYGVNVDIDDSIFVIE